MWHHPFFAYNPKKALLHLVQGPCQYLPSLKYLSPSPHFSSPSCSWLLYLPSVALFTFYSNSGCLLSIYREPIQTHHLLDPSSNIHAPTPSQHRTKLTTVISTPKHTHVLNLQTSDMVISPHFQEENGDKSLTTINKAGKHFSLVSDRWAHGIWKILLFITSALLSSTGQAQSGQAINPPGLD